MNKNFAQPFKHSRFTATRLLVEVQENRFLQYEDRDEMGTDFYSVPSLDVDESSAVVQQLAKFLYENGLILNRFRDIARETSVGFSFVDDTPGGASEEVCFHVQADQMNNAAEDEAAQLVSLDTMLDNFGRSPTFPRIVELGIARIISERKMLEEARSK